MKQLPEDWLTSDLIDFEYKKYVLMAYFQSVKTNFGECRIFPDLTDLQRHYKASGNLIRKKELLKALFPGELKGVDMTSLQFIYEQLAADTDVMKEIDEILNFALPRFEEALGLGKEIKEEADQLLEVSPVGILPLERKTGYLFVYEHADRNTTIYRYQLSIFDSSESDYPKLNTTFLRKQAYSLSETFSGMKLRLIREHKELPNPATLLVEVKRSLPYMETVLPLAQQRVSSFIQRGLA